MDVLDLAKELIACPSVTPEDAGAQEKLAAFLEDAGFTCHHLPFGDGDERVPNLFARIGREGPHLCYAGHTDVVPPGPLERWTSGPFDPQIRDGVLYGRGASDMKGSVAAFAVAAARYLKDHDLKGSISLLITGDEEGPAVNGTVKVLEWMAENGHSPDVALVGEPTNPEHLGQEIKIGRRGSLTGTLRVTGRQGHVAYPHLADNPLPRLTALAGALAAYIFDEGTDFFPPTNLELTSIDTGNPADNVIPAAGTARFNIRFNDGWNADTLEQTLRRILDAVSKDYTLDLSCGAESFMTQPGDWSAIVQQAVKDVTGKEPAYTTTGGTSDARFIVKYCPVIECGGVNKTIHQIDESAAVDDLQKLTEIYGRVLALYFKS
ncbi:MAG: succinyl-diaminopimelate desuccinylase [Alphaproteobacteria bacterium]|nr:succinyl-diaminopimelate desuccinylase [Alphaproteobacteria bacterium]